MQGNIRYNVFIYKNALDIMPRLRKNATIEKKIQKNLTLLAALSLIFSFFQEAFRQEIGLFTEKGGQWSSKPASADSHRSHAAHSCQAVADEKIRGNIPPRGGWPQLRAQSNSRWRRRSLHQSV
jgi:hypothetical protein